MATKHLIYESSFIEDTSRLIDLISKSSKTISDKKIKAKVKDWAQGYYDLVEFFSPNDDTYKAFIRLSNSINNVRLIKKEWLHDLRIILKAYQNTTIRSKKVKPMGVVGKSILSPILLKKIKDRKIFVLGREANDNWDRGNWNSCGILMRVILERSLDIRHQDVKAKQGLKDKINFCLNNSIFGKSVSEALRKLDHSTKITGDIVAHDSNILLDGDDIELAILPFRIVAKDIFNL